MMRLASNTAPYLIEPIHVNFVINKPIATHKTIIFALEMALYITRWQLSTPLMNIAIQFAKSSGVAVSWKQVAFANLVCAPLFFFVDKFILIHVRTHITRIIKHFKHN